MLHLLKARKRVFIVSGLLLLLATFVYARWIRDEGPLAAGAKADRVVVTKSERKLQLYEGGTLLKTYRVSLGRNPSGPKTQAGDHRTPEGFYTLDWRNPQSKYYLSLHISYPSAADVVIARQRGANSGGDIMVHGLPNRLGWIWKFHRMWDWTDGCIAVTNSEMDEIWRAVSDGTPIEIRP